MIRKGDRKDILEEFDILNDDIDMLDEKEEEDISTLFPDDDVITEDDLDLLEDEDFDDDDIDDDEISSSELDSEALKIRIDRDWRAIDYAAFEKPVTRDEFSDEFVTEWAVLKTALLSDFYKKVSPFIKLDCCGGIEDVNESVIHIARKARKLAIVRLKEHKRETRPLATTLVKEVFMSNEDPEVAMEKATKLMIAHEAIANLVGGSSPVLKDMIILLARYYK